MKKRKKSGPICQILRPHYYALAFILIFSIGCTSIKLIADYDKQIDSTAMAFQKNVEMHLIKLERNIGTDSSSYENNIDFYDEAKVESSSIKVRAAALPKNELTLLQIDLLIQNFNNLEKIMNWGWRGMISLSLRKSFNTGTTAILK